MTDIYTTTSLHDAEQHDYFMMKKEEWKEKFSNYFSDRQKQWISYLLFYVIKYLKYSLSKFLVPYFVFLSYFVSIFIAQWNMSHQKFIDNIESQKKHVFHYLINHKTRLDRKIHSNEVEKVQSRRKHLIEFILTQYSCKQATYQYNNDDLSLINKNVIFSDPLSVLLNKLHFETVFKGLALLFSSHIDDRSIHVTHYDKCFVISFNIDWIFLNNKLTLKPEILIVALNDHVVMNDYYHSYQSDMQYIEDIHTLHENVKKEELTFYKTFPKNETNYMQLINAESRSQEQIIGLYDFWMSDHHYSFFGYSKYIRRIIGFCMFVVCFLFNPIIEQYNQFMKETRSEKKKY